MVLSLLCMVLLFSGSFQYEKHSQMVSLLRTTARGRQPFIRAKRRSFIFILICIVGILYGVQLYYTARQYGLSQVFAPVQSIQILNSFPLKWNILSYAIVLVIVRVLFYLLIADLLLQLSVLMDQKIVIIAFVGLMILPIILGQSGNALFDKISYFNLLNINEMVLGQASIILELIKAGVLLGILILARIMAIRKWCE
jgi:hypothetical protein